MKGTHSKYRRPNGATEWLEAIERAPLYTHVEEVERTIVELINRRRKALVADYGDRHDLPVIDSYHGEMGFPLHPTASAAIVRVMRELAECTHPLAEADGTLYSKDQPKILQGLCAEHIFDRFRTAPPMHGIPGRTVLAEEVLVIPYSALAMFEAVMSALADEAPGGVVLCPAGFYKEYHQHIQKFGLKLAQFETDIWDNCRIDPAILRAAIRRVRASGEVLAAIGLTIPGNPLIAEYSVDELRGLGRVLVEEDARAVVDASFDKIVPTYVPLAAVDVEVDGERHSLYERVMTISGLSKSHMAFGPLKIGVACCGSKHWRDAVRAMATLTFQRETTALAASLLETTPTSYVLGASVDFVDKLGAATAFIDRVNAERPEPILQVVGQARYGPFLVLSLASSLLKQAGITRGHELSELLIKECGVDNVAADRVGIHYPCVRLNVHCSRIAAKKDPALTPVMLARIVDLADRIGAGEVTYKSSMSALPVALRRQLSVRRIAVLGREGQRWAGSVRWPFDHELWTTSLAVAAADDVYAPSISDLAHAVHAVVMSEDEAVTSLEPWLRSCVAQSLLILESPEQLGECSQAVQRGVDARKLRIVSWAEVRAAAAEARLGDTVTGAPRVGA